MQSTTALTVELRELVENGVDLWDFYYPSYYTGVEKEAFERKVIDHYYFRQIGQETVGRFLHMFRTRIKEVMPYYIDLYKTVQIMHNIEDPFGNVDIVETFTQETTGSTSGESSGSLTGNTTGTSTTSGTATGTSTSSETVSGTSTNKGNSSDAETKKEDKTTTESKLKKFSNTPQNYVGNLDHFMTEATVEDNTITDGVTSTGSILKEFSENGTTSSTSEGSGSNSSTSEGSGSTETNSSETSSATSSQETSGTVKHTLTRKGNQGVNTYAHDMIEFRKSIINIDMMVINELNDLFLGVY